MIRPFTALCLIVAGGSGLYLYSTTLAIIVTLTVPAYIIVALVLQPMLHANTEERFQKGALLFRQLRRNVDRQMDEQVACAPRSPEPRYALSLDPEDLSGLRPGRNLKRLRLAGQRRNRDRAPQSDLREGD